MRKRLFIILAIVLLLFLGLWWVYWSNNQPLKEQEYFPRSPTPEERDAARKLPKEQCGCWDGRNNICLPQADCF